MPVPLLEQPAQAHIMTVRIPNRDFDAGSRRETLAEWPAQLEMQTLACLSAAQVRRAVWPYSEFRQELQLVVEDGSGNPKWIILGPEICFVRRGNRYDEILCADPLRETLLSIWFDMH